MSPVRRRMQEVWSLWLGQWPLSFLCHQHPHTQAQGKRKWEAIGQPYSTLSTPLDEGYFHTESELSWTCSVFIVFFSGDFFFVAAVVEFSPAVWKWPAAHVFSCVLYAAFSQRATTNFLQTPKWFASNQQKSGGRGKDYFQRFDHLSLFSAPSGSPEWRLREAVQHLPQTAHHQNGVSHQSESAWPIKTSTSLPHRSLSLSQTLLLVQACLCGRWVEEGVFIENSGFHTNGLSRTRNVVFLWERPGTQRSRCYHRKMWFSSRSAEC